MEANLVKYLEKIKSFLGSEEDFKTEVIKIIEEKTKVCLSEKNIEIKNHRIFISGNSYIKTEILLKKENILAILRECFPKKTILDIL